MKYYMYKTGDTAFNNIELGVVTAVAAWFKSLGVKGDVEISTDVSSDHLKLKATAGTVSFTITAEDELLKIAKLRASVKMSQDSLEILDLDGGYNEYKNRTNP